MIKLENISVLDLIYHPNGAKRLGEKDSAIIEFLRKYNIRSYGELEASLEDGKFDKTITIDTFHSLQYALDAAKERITTLDKDSVIPEIYTFDTLDKFGIDNKTSNITDTNNQANVLPYAQPFSVGVLNNYLKSISIAEAKQRLSQYYIGEYNRLYNSFEVGRTIGRKKAKHIAELMRFYDEQVVRQSLTNPNVRDCNLFTIDLEPRIEIVNSQIKDITEYLFEVGDEYIFGKNTPTTKKKMDFVMGNIRSESSEEIRRRWGEMLAYFCTLEEAGRNILAEQEIPVIIGDSITRTKTRPIDRFITKRR